MASNYDTTTKFKVDISELKSAMQEAKRQIQIANSEFKAISSSMEDWAKSSEGLEAKLKQLNSNLNSQKTILSNLERQYELTVAEMGEGSAEADRLKIAINNQKAVINGTQREIDKYENALDELGDAEAEAGDDAEELAEDLENAGDKAKDAGDGFTVFKGVLANLVTQGINLALDGIKSLGGAMVSMVKESVGAYAEYEQLVGGVETLFKDSADTVMTYANNAYKTAGLSANEYMSTVTSFSASLLGALGGDTAESAKIANRAIIDMSDNANKMGTDMTSIQNAYNGFAKQNYTMLDNLKLGYGGTQAEMQRLIADASQMTEIQEKLGITVDESSMSFDNIINAISVMQDSLGIAGATASEASTTIEGSVASMKSAWTNLVTGMADENADFDQLVTNLVESVTTMLANVLPIATQAINGLAELFRSLAPILITELPKIIDEVIPTLLDSLATLLEAVLQAIIGSLPSLTQTLIDVLLQLITTLLGMTPEIVTTLIQMIDILIQALTTALPQIVLAIVEVVPQIIEALLAELPTFIQTCIDFFLAMIEAVPVLIEALVTALPDVIDTVITGLVNGIDALIEGAITLLMAIVDAIPLILPVLIDALPQILDTLITGLIEAMPQLLEGAVEFLLAIVDAIPLIVIPLIDALPKILETITTTLIDNVPLLLSTAIQLFMAIVNAIPQIVTSLSKSLPKIIDSITNALIDNIPLLLSTAVQLFMAIVQAIPQIVVALGKAFPQIISSVLSLMGDLAKSLASNLATLGTTLASSMRSIGSNLISGLWNGINDMTNWIKDKIKGFGDSVVSGLKNFFGIHSPSKLMADEIGKFIPEGIAVGIDKNAKSVMNAMKDLTMDTVGATRNGLNATTTGVIGGGLVNNFTQVINAPQQLSRLDIYRQTKNLLGYAGGAY